jgi:phosphoribosylformylglycinamidine synthase
VSGLIRNGDVTAAHDLSDGGLLIALAEMAMASGIGAELAAAPDDVPSHAFWFGEDQARYVLTVNADKADEVMQAIRAARVPLRRLGITKGAALTIAGERAMLVANLRERHDGWLPGYMAGRRQPKSAALKS